MVDAPPMPPIPADTYQGPPLPPGFGYPPPTEREFMSVHSLKFMLEDDKIPAGAKRLFWGYFNKFASLTNLEDYDIERLLASYDYSCLIYKMKQRQPKALIDNKTGMPLDPMKIIDTQFDEDMFLQEGRDYLFIQLKRSKGALNLQLLAPRTIPQQFLYPPNQQAQKRPGFFSRLMGHGGD